MGNPEKGAEESNVCVSDFNRENDKTSSVLQKQSSSSSAPNGPPCLAVLRKLSQPPASVTFDHDYAKPTVTHGPTLSSSAPLQISVKVEVEELDEATLRKKTQKKKRPAQPTATYPDQLYKIDIEQMYDITDSIHRRSDNPADKYLSVELKNTWGSALKITEDIDRYEVLIQEAFRTWSYSVLQKEEQETPLFYQCHICCMAWWFLEPFRRHIRVHDKSDLKVWYIEGNVDSFIVASDQLILKQTYIECAGNCYRCGNSYNEHAKHYQSSYNCDKCKMILTNCSTSFRHKCQCRAVDSSKGRCSVCSVQRASKNDLEEHMRTAHFVRSDIPVPFLLSECGHCKKHYLETETHYCTRKEQYCKHCSKTFPTKWLLQNHLKMVEKDSFCNICGKHFGKTCMLTKHILEHTEHFLMMFKCPEVECDQNIVFAYIGQAIISHYYTHKRQCHKNPAYSAYRLADRVLVPIQCINPKHDTFKNMKAAPPKAASASKPTDIESLGSYQICGNIIVKEEVLDLESREESGCESDEGAMDYARMLAKVFNVVDDVGDSKKQAPIRRNKTKTTPYDPSKHIKNLPSITQNDTIKPQEETETRIRPKILRKILHNPAKTNQNEAKAPKKQPKTTKTTDQQIKPKPILNPNESSNTNSRPTSVGSLSSTSKTVKVKPYNKANRVISSKEPSALSKAPVASKDPAGLDSSTVTVTTFAKVQRKMSDVEPNNTQVHSKVSGEHKDFQTQAVNKSQKSVESEEAIETEMLTEIKMEPVDFDSLIDIQDDPIIIKPEPIEACFGSSYSEYSSFNENRHIDSGTIIGETSPKSFDNDSSQNSTWVIDSQTDESQTGSCQNFNIQNDSQDSEMFVRIKEEPCDIDDGQYDEDFNSEIGLTNYLAVKMEPEDVKKELLESNDLNIDVTDIESRAERLKTRKYMIRRRQKITILSPSEIGITLKKIVKKDEQIIKLVEKEIGEGNEPTEVTICVPENITKAKREKKAKKKEKKPSEKTVEYDTDGNKIKKKYTCHKCGYTQVHKLFCLHKQSNCEFRPSRNKYKCTKCGSSFKKFKSYLAHFVSHGLYEYECPSCGERLNKICEMVPHFHRHIKTNYVPYWSMSEDNPNGEQNRCRVCHEEVQEKDFFEHFESHLVLKEEGDYSDVEAQSPSKKKKKLPEKKKQEMETILDIELPPAPVFESTSTKRLKGDSLRIALAQLHADTQAKDCRICGRVFNRRNDIKRHIVEHLLGDAYSKKDSMPNLMLRCQICQADYSKPEGYKFHMREHAGLPIYRCDLCDKTFSDSSNFAKHKKTHNMRVMVCDICGKKFHAKCALEKHIIMHMTTEPIICKLCDNRRFFEMSMYKKHQRLVHKKIFPRITCPQCDGVTFTSLKEKWEHAWEVHKERNVKADCPVCPQRFRKYQQLKQHAKSMHNVDVRKFYENKNNIKDSKEKKRKPTYVFKNKKETLIVVDDM